MAIEYVDAGQAVDNSSLSGIVGSAPPVTNGVTYERILNARSGNRLEILSGIAANGISYQLHFLTTLESYRHSL